jgi:hypothetical protein
VESYRWLPQLRSLAWAGLGDSERARLAFTEARQGFLAQSIAYDAALVSLEFAVHLLQEGRTSEVRELAREMIQIFQSQEIHREALAALAVFQGAAALESATVELAREVADFLDNRRGHRRAVGPVQRSGSVAGCRRPPYFVTAA